MRESKAVTVMRRVTTMRRILRARKIAKVMINFQIRMRRARSYPRGERNSFSRKTQIKENSISKLKIKRKLRITARRLRKTILNSLEKFSQERNAYPLFRT